MNKQENEGEMHDVQQEKNKRTKARQTIDIKDLLLVNVFAVFCLNSASTGLL